MGKLTYDLWPMTYDLWPMTYDPWPMTYDPWPMTYDRPNLTKQFHTGNVCNQFDKYRSYMHAINLINIQAIYVYY